MFCDGERNDKFQAYNSLERQEMILLEIAAVRAEKIFPESVPYKMLGVQKRDSALSNPPASVAWCSTFICQSRKDRARKRLWLAVLSHLLSSVRQAVGHGRLSDKQPMQ